MTSPKEPQSLSDLLKQAQGAASGEASDQQAEKPAEENEPPIPPSPESEEDEDSIPEGPGFMALYTTLMLLLMTFFIVLVSMGTPSEGEFEKGKKSLQASFSLMGLSGSKEAMFFVYSVLKIQNSLVKETLDNHLNKEQNMVEDEPKSAVGDDVYWQDGLSKEEATQLHRFVSLGFSIAASDATKKYLRVRFPHDKIFHPGTAELISTFRSSLESFLNIIGTDYTKLVIRVYTIEEPDEETGLSSPRELSALRAKVVSDMIRNIQSVDDSKIIPVGYGEYYAGIETVPEDKKEIVELNIYNLWGQSVAKEEVEDIEGVEVSEGS